jgi:hypothetical protein
MALFLSSVRILDVYEKSGNPDVGACFPSIPYLGGVASSVSAQPELPENGNI